MIGRKIGPYEIQSLLGKGGMGEVYSAKDTNLDRNVALKSLPEAFSKDPERVARFEREAKILASLNHPNIAAIYGLEEADGKRLLILELVEGETLAERIKKGPIPVEEALHLALQITEGLEAAHEKGIIHRDLKPGNIKLTPEGKVKILDFGLAKAFEEEPPATDASHSPTLTDQMTQAGVILGTAAYMSPEQAKGKPTDKKADIWAFGAVLYEMLTGKRAFEGDTITVTLGAIIHKEPDWDALPQSTPGVSRLLLRQCLKKDPHHRLQHIDDARIEIEEAISEPTSFSVSTELPPTQLGWKRAVPWSIAAGLAIIAGALAISIWTSPSPTPPLIKKFAITPTSPLADLNGNELAISPDGQRIVYISSGQVGRQLYVRSVDELTATPIAGAQGAVGGNPFFSPDGESIAYFGTGGLMKIPLTGGTPIMVSSASTAGGRSGSWTGETIVFTAGVGRGGLFKVSSAGGERENLATVDNEKGEVGYGWPQILPGGEAVLFTISRGQVNFEIAALSLQTGEKKVLLQGIQARYLPTGHLVYGLSGTGTLMAAPFDLENLEVTGDAVPILQGMRRTGSVIDYSVSNEGTLIYVPAGEGRSKWNLVWVDRQGRETLVTEEARDYGNPRISPDGKQVAFWADGEGGRNVWIYDTEGDSFRRLTYEGRLNSTPNWTLDGKWIVFNSNRDGPRNLYRRPADGSGSAERLTTGQSVESSNSFLPDGSVLVFHQFNQSQDLHIVEMEGDRAARPFIASSANECCAKFSPDGQWIAYVSDETGKLQVYVSPYLEPEIKWLVSGEEGGRQPVWSPDGEELFYRSANKMMVAPVQTEPTFSPGRPRELFEGPYIEESINSAYQAYDISPDGQRFLMIRPNLEQTQPDQLVVVLNWFEELKRLAPTD